MASFSEWITRHTAEHQLRLGLAFCLIMGAAIAFDITLVYAMETDSISWRTWLATQEHPTLIAAGVLFGVLVCWLVRTSWVLVMFMGIMTGHLFVHA